MTKAKKEQTENTNGYDPGEGKDVIDLFDDLDLKLAQTKQRHREEVKAISEERKDLLEKAKTDYGIPKQVMNALLNRRKLEKKIDGIADAFEGDYADDYELLVDAYGKAYAEAG